MSACSEGNGVRQLHRTWKEYGRLKQPGVGGRESSRVERVKAIAKSTAIRAASRLRRSSSRQVVFKRANPTPRFRGSASGTPLRYPIPSAAISPTLAWDGRVSRSGQRLTGFSGVRRHDNTPPRFPASVTHSVSKHDWQARRLLSVDGRYAPLCCFLLAAIDIGISIIKACGAEPGRGMYGQCPWTQRILDLTSRFERSQPRPCMSQWNIPRIQARGEHERITPGRH